MLIFDSFCLGKLTQSGVTTCEIEKEKTRQARKDKWSSGTISLFHQPLVEVRDVIHIVADVILIYLARSTKNIIDESLLWLLLEGFWLVPTSAKVPENCTGSVPSGSLGSWVFWCSKRFLRNSS
jgi:hypothetical protein